MAKSLRELIRELVDEELASIDELTSSGAAGSYNTPYAFTGNSAAGERRRKKNALKSGYSLVGGDDAETNSAKKKRLPEGIREQGLSIPGLAPGELPADWPGHDKDVKSLRKKLDKESVNEEPMLGRGMSAAVLAADTDESDREYIAARNRRERDAKQGIDREESDKRESERRAQRRKEKYGESVVAEIRAIVREVLDEAKINKPFWKSARSGRFGARKVNDGIRYFEKEDAARAYRSGIKHAQRIHEKELEETGDAEIVESPEQGREDGHRILDDMTRFVYGNRRDIKQGHMANDAAMMLRSMKQIIDGLTQLSATAESMKEADGDDEMMSMECNECGAKWTGQPLDECPECGSTDTEHPPRWTP